MGRVGGEEEEATADEREREREKQKLGIDLLSLFEESELRNDIDKTRRRERERERLLNRSATRTGGERREFAGNELSWAFFSTSGGFLTQTADDAAPFTRANPPKRMLVLSM